MKVESIEHETGYMKLWILQEYGRSIDFDVIVSDCDQWNMVEEKNRKLSLCILFVEDNNLLKTIPWLT